MQLNRLLTYFSTWSHCNNNKQKQVSVLLRSKIVDYFSVFFLFISLILVLVNISTLYNNFFSIPHWDHWGWLKLYYSKGFWTTTTAQYNEHRQFFPSFVFALDQIVDNGRNYLLITALIFIQLITFYLVIVPAVKFLPRAVYLVILGFSLLCATWFQQGENLFWPISFHTLFCNLSILLSLLYWSKLLDFFSNEERLNYKLLGLSLLWAVIATFSFGQGVTVWLFFIIISLFKLNLRATFCIIASFIMTIIVYFHNYHSPHSHSSPLLSVQKPIEVLEYMSVYIARIFLRAEPNLNNLSYYDLLQCNIFGVAALSCFVILIGYYLLRKKNHAFEHFYLGVLAMGVCSALITALARVDFGPLQAGATRYITIQLLFWNGLLIVMLCWFFQHLKNSSWISFSLVALSLGFLILRFTPPHFQTLNFYAQRKAIQEQIMRGALIQIFDQSRWRAHIHPAYNQTSRLLRYLLQHKITILSQFSANVIGQNITQFEVLPQECASILIDKKFSLANNDNFLIITGEIYSDSLTNRDVILVVDRGSGTLIGWGNTGAGYELVRDGFDHSHEWVVYARSQGDSGFDYYIQKANNQVCKLQEEKGVEHISSLYRTGSFNSLFPFSKSFQSFYENELRNF